MEFKCDFCWLVRALDEREQDQIPIESVRSEQRKVNKCARGHYQFVSEAGKARKVMEIGA